MLLAVDTGNTNTMFAVFEGDTIRAQFRIATQYNRTADEYMVWLKAMFAHAQIPFSSITGAIIATVVPQALYEQRMLCRNYFDVEALVVGDKSLKLGMDVQIDNPAEVGADRLVNAYAAWHQFKKPLVVLDFGTATTFDVVDGKGAYIGGSIAPGINLSLDALHRAAAKLPTVAVAKPATAIGKNTETAMQSGIFYGYIGLIEGMVARMETEFGSALEVVATGGLSPLFAAGTSVIKHVDADLTIRGLKAIYTLNSK